MGEPSDSHSPLHCGSKNGELEPSCWKFGAADGYVCLLRGKGSLAAYSHICSNCAREYSPPTIDRAPLDTTDMLLQRCGTYSYYDKSQRFRMSPSFKRFLSGIGCYNIKMK